MFASMMGGIRNDIVEHLFKVKFRKETVPARQTPFFKTQKMVLNRGEEGAARPAQREAKKVGRNEDCPCGSGKKYKKCHGQ